MTGGRSFIVLAVVIVANWSPAGRAGRGVNGRGGRPADQALDLGVPYRSPWPSPLLTLAVYIG
jgi:hypothetical protein